MLLVPPQYEFLGTSACQARATEMSAIFHRCFCRSPGEQWPVERFESFLAYGHAMAIATTDSIYSTCCYMTGGDSAEVISMATDPLYQHKGYATVLLRHLCAVWRTQGIRTAVLVVRQSNQVAQYVYRKCGFIPGASVHGAYTGTLAENGIKMKCLL